MKAPGNTLIAHLESLRRTRLSCVVATALLYPVGYLISHRVIGTLMRWSFPESVGRLHDFAPMEVFWVQLKLALIPALVMVSPWNLLQVWRFLLPALCREEGKAFGGRILFASIVFCGGVILPMLMNFSGGFATPELQPILGPANFLNLAGWLMLAFGVMFQAPIVVLLAVPARLLFELG